ncbi:MAG: Rieske 2Fe-2S domain-containing protein, partial [Burkholderiaceae bacterium]
MIDPAGYSSAAILADEQRRIFRRAWHLAGLARDTPQENDYVTRKIGLTDLVIHRHGGRIVAYANVCPHRFAALFDSPSGNAPIRCPYHLWTFDNRGIAVGVPHRHGEDLACYQTPGLRLDMWRVELVGEFVFVSAEPAAELADFLGPMLSTLRQLAEAVGDEQHRVTQTIAADWKIVLQNTVEFDHAFSVHAETFAKAIQKPLQVEGDAEAVNSISYVTRLDPARHASRRDARVDSIFRRAGVPYPDGYRHHLIFPSTSIGYTDNQQLAIMDYQPTAAGSCTMYAR